MDIGIIGGGSAAVGLLDVLAREAGTPGAVTVFEPSPHLWRGRPYAPDLDPVLVNSPPAIMSIRHDDADHYASWLGARGEAHLDPDLGRPLVPRSLYGEYLEHAAEKAIADLREHGCHVQVVAAAVVGAAPGAGRLALRTSEGREHVVDRIALCVGGGTPQDLYGLGGAPGFARDPYPLARTLDEVPPHADVAVIGSGLTAVDVVVSLAARGHTGRISLVSRTGMLPHVWQRPIAYQPRHLTVARVGELPARDGELTLEHLTGLLRAEMADAGEDLDALLADLRAARTDDPVVRLRRQIDAITAPEIGRRVLQVAAHTVGPYAWRLLAERDRHRLRAQSRIAISVASPMVPVNAVRLLQLFDSGRLEVLAGARGITRENGRFSIETGTGARRADVVVNAVNPAPHAVPPAAAGLVDDLVATGVAARHPSGGLVAADPRVHVVGDLAGGGSFLTSSIPGIAARAAAAARAILAGPQPSAAGPVP
ncbi:FAD/NAD(P)-binding protein [Pseudonocardia kunmingensis]|uniref:Putative NAD(P)/FAD-binding protein YdhS n=1 Tax=Pseudonocardia kunmingensis TaxID=630975 RepID=A0A543DL39_9PSEU|nr:FAD/NAD(P)-binding protein [Pseudonocardia kunmingensis]TQM10021.1 putative NAD(P)/FAD-binding protein YdhS [Pseudonocardia kunmingensis]